MGDPRLGPQPAADLTGTVVDDLMARAQAARDHAAATGHLADDLDDVDDEDPRRARRRGRWEALVPSVIGDPRLADVTDDGVRSALAGWASAIVEERARTVLVLTGPIGVGKSHAAYAALRPIIGADRTVVGGHVGELLDRLRPDPDGRGRDAMGPLVDADVVLLDDLGDERPSDWTVERLGLLIHRRHAACRPMVITTNIASGDLRTHLAPHIGERAVSRIADDHLVIRLTGPDRRTAS